MDKQKLSVIFALAFFATFMFTFAIAEDPELKKDYFGRWFEDKTRLVHD